MNVLALIPARGGSKRLPRKNIKLLNGKPLIEWTISAAKNSQFISNVTVSTDDNEIAEVAKKSGARVPFIRPSHLANDTADSISVVKHAIEYYKKEGQKYDYVMLLQPTSPLRTSAHIDKAISLLKDRNADAVISVCLCDHSPLWSGQLGAGYFMGNFLKEVIKNARSQDLPDYYRLNGAIYLIKVDALIANNTFFLDENIFAYVMPSEASVDIDNPIDFKFAEMLIKEFNSNNE